MIRWGVGLRLVAREFRGEEEAMYAATPPLEMMRVMLSLAASRRGHKVPYQLGVLDVSRAFFQAECHVDTFVALPPELRDQHPGMCWKLRKGHVWHEAGSPGMAEGVLQEDGVMGF